MADSRRVTHSRRELLELVPKSGLAVEVGVWAGDFSVDILDVVKPTQLVLIDTWQDYWGQAGDVTYGCVQSRFADDARIVTWRGLSQEMIPRLPDRAVSFAYVDGDHEFESVLQDLESLLPKMHPGGWLCGHDFCCCNDYGVVRAVAVFCDRHHLRIDAMTDEPLAPVLGSDRMHYPPLVAYNSFGIKVPL